MADGLHWDVLDEVFPYKENLVNVLFQVLACIQLWGDIKGFEGIYLAMKQQQLGLLPKIVSPSLQSLYGIYYYSIFLSVLDKTYLLGS